MTLVSFLAGFYLGGWFILAVEEVTTHHRQWAGPSLLRKLLESGLWPAGMVLGVVLGFRDGIVARRRRP